PKRRKFHDRSNWRSPFLRPGANPAPSRRRVPWAGQGDVRYPPDLLCSHSGLCRGARVSAVLLCSVSPRASSLSSSLRLTAAAMVYLDSWDDFVERSVQLFRADPSATRYVTKYRHCEGKLVLKVTDDRECLKFKTDQAQDAKKMEKLNNIFFALMTRGPDADISEVAGKEQAEQQQSKKGRGRRQ
ncbi:unnamed protein product, partial [Urochloa humidicola]